MINENLMDKLNELGFGTDVDALENYVAHLQDAAGMGDAEVTDEVYDMYRKLLSELKPDSLILTRNWEVEDEDFTEYDDILKVYGMKSINTIKDIEDLNYFKDVLVKTGNRYTMMASTKLNGHAIRAVYRYGKLVGGSTRGRTKKGRDITKTLRNIMPEYVDKWKDVELLEVRGEALVSFENFEKVKHILKNPLSAVTSLIRESASEAEMKLLDVVCYKIIIGDDLDNLHFNSLEDEFIELKECGFKTPIYKKFDDLGADNFEDKINEIIEYFEDIQRQGLIPYDTDGIVVGINNDAEFYGLGPNGNTWLGNFALKMGTKWGTKVYTSVVERIQWIYGKKYITPKAIVTPVRTSNGAEVKNVPLYNVGVMERLHILPGSTVYFLFGGETGVSLCDRYGNKVTEMDR